MDLSGRHALVTGGAGHIGLAVGEALVEMGAAVAVVDLDEAACQERAATLSRGQDRGAAVALACDLRDLDASHELVHRATREMGGLDILVHCAAHVGDAELPGWNLGFEGQTAEAFEGAMRLELTSIFVIAQEARKALAASGHGSAILLGSIYGVVGPMPSLYKGTHMANPVAYGVSKGGVLQMTRYLAIELAPDVRVNAISPGGVWRDQPEVFQQRYASNTPLGRMATEEDLKGAVAYLASDLSSYVTGHNLVVDEGWTAW